MGIPQITIVIPTCNRPQLLLRSVRSALTHAGSDVEVIVIPNGPDQSYKQSLAEFVSDERVHIHAISTANSNTARNHGLALARGKYIRFLDDDDYLLEHSAEQVSMLEATGSEICSGLVESIDQGGMSLGHLGSPQTEDFVCAAVSMSAFRLPVGNVFLRSCLSECEWDTNAVRSQDYIWMIKLAAQRDWGWVHLEEAVGVWYQHNMPRISSVAAMKGREELVISNLLDLHAHLAQDRRGSMERDAAIAAALWRYAHRGFPYRPIHWRKIARKALLISPESRPDTPAYQCGALRALPPVATECALAPIRRVTRLYRDLRENFCHSYRREL